MKDTSELAAPVILAKDLDLVFPSEVEWPAIEALLTSAQAASDLSKLDVLVPEALCCNGQKLAAATANRRELFLPALENLGIAGLFDAVLTTGDIGMDAPEEQYLSRLTLRLDAEVPSRLEVSVSYDGGPWEKLAEKTVEAKRQSIDLPFVPRRCGTLRLRLEGAGQITLRGLAKTMAKAQGGIFAAGKEG